MLICLCGNSDKSMNKYDADSSKTIINSIINRVDDIERIKVIPIIFNCKNIVRQIMY